MVEKVLNHSNHHSSVCNLVKFRGKVWEPIFHRDPLKKWTSTHGTHTLTRVTYAWKIWFEIVNTNTSALRLNEVCSWVAAAAVALAVAQPHLAVGATTKNVIITMCMYAVYAYSKTMIGTMKAPLNFGHCRHSTHLYINLYVVSRTARASVDNNNTAHSRKHPHIISGNGIKKWCYYGKQAQNIGGTRFSLQNMSRWLLVVLAIAILSAILVMAPKIRLRNVRP